MVRKRRSSQQGETSLQQFLVALFKKERLTTRTAAKIAGCSASAISDWMRGAYPAAETIPALKRLCDHYRISLSIALTGEADASANTAAAPTPQPATLSLAEFTEEQVLNGIYRLQLTRLIPQGKKKEPTD